MNSRGIPIFVSARNFYMLLMWSKPYSQSLTWVVKGLVACGLLLGTICTRPNLPKSVKFYLIN